MPILYNIYHAYVKDLPITVYKPYISIFSNINLTIFIYYSVVNVRTVELGHFRENFFNLEFLQEAKFVLLSSNIAETKINFRKKPLANIFTTTQVLLQQLKIENIFQIMLLMPREGS